MKKVILDTDIGSDVDDTLALAYLLKYSNDNILGVTTTSTRVRERAIFAKKIVNLVNPNIPVFYNLKTERKEIKNYLKPKDYGLITDDEINKTDSELGIEDNGIEFIINSICKNPGEITLIGIGPATNIAKSILKIGNNKKIKDIYLMSGCVANYDKKLWKKPEYNLRSDLFAFDIIKRSNIPITLVGHDSNGLIYNKGDWQLELLKDVSSGELANLLYNHVETYFNLTGRNKKVMWDPVAVGSFLCPDLYVFNYVAPEVTEKGQMYCHCMIKNHIRGVRDVDYHKLNEFIIFNIIKSD